MSMRELTTGYCIECGISVISDTDRAPLIFRLGVGRVAEDEAGNQVVIVPPDDECQAVEIPGLYRCARCAGLRESGEINSGVHPSDAFQFLTEKYLPHKDSFMSLYGSAMSNRMRDRHLAQIDQAVNAAAVIASFTARYGQPVDTAQLVVPEDAEDDGPCEHWDSPDKIEATLQTVELGENGMTFRCPCCDELHPADRLFESLELFSSFMSDSKD